MKINLDTKLNIGDSIFFFDWMRPGAQITNIYVEYEEYREEPRISFGWAQSELGPDGWELWDEGEVNLEDLGKTFWLTYEDMINANKAKWIEYQISEDGYLERDCNQEMDRCYTKEKVGCKGCPYFSDNGKQLCEYK